MKTIFSYVIVILLLFSLTLGVFAENKHPTGLKREKLSSIKETCKLMSKTSASLSPSVDLTSGMPQVGDQGWQGSCTAWAAAYGLKTYHEGLNQCWALNTSLHQFSPSYVYNQINGGYDGGSYITDAMNLIKNQGCSTLNRMPYNQNDYTSQPSQEARNQASHYKIAQWYYTNYGDVATMKWWLDTYRTPLVIGIPIDDDFDTLSLTNQIYDSYTSSRGGHAITIIGYDDSIQAFKIQNSWGKSWGINGYGYISYNLISNPVFNAGYPTYAYGMEDIQEDYREYFTIQRKVKFDKYIKPSSNIVGSQWAYWVKVGGKKIVKGQTLITDAANYYIKVSENDGASKYDDVKIVTGNLKYGTNKIKVTVKENNGIYKGKTVSWYFYLIRTDKKTVS